MSRLVKLWRKLLCHFGSHRYFIINRCGAQSHHVGCLDCPRQWGMNHGVRAFLPWNEVAEFHRETYGYQPLSQGGTK